jgi:hypothetical protein
MRRPPASFAAILLVAIAAPAVGAEDYAPQPQDQLRAMLKITWSPGADLPQGFQDSDGGFIGSTLITAAGFCSGIDADNLKKPGRYPRGFLSKAWALDVESNPKQWQPLPDFPGAARQGLFSAELDNTLYFWGGFSYTAPFCYADGWRLAKRGETWTWTPLPPLPWKLAAAGACVIEKKIYVIGGATGGTTRTVVDNWVFDPADQQWAASATSRSRAATFLRPPTRGAGPCAA